MLFCSGTLSATTGMICALNCPVDVATTGCSRKNRYRSSLHVLHVMGGHVFCPVFISPFLFQQTALLLIHSVLRQQVPAALANSHPSSICVTSLMGPCVCWDKWPWKAMKIAGQCLCLEKTQKRSSWWHFAAFIFLDDASSFISLGILLCPLFLF